MPGHKQGIFTASALPGLGSVPSSAFPYQEMGGPLCPGCVGHSIQYLLRTYSDDNSRYTKPFDCDFAHCFEVINSRQYFTARHFVVPELTAVPLRSRLRLIIGPGLPSSTHRQAILLWRSVLINARNANVSHGNFLNKQARLVSREAKKGPRNFLPYLTYLGEAWQGTREYSRRQS